MYHTITDDESILIREKARGLGYLNQHYFVNDYISRDQ